MDGLDFVGFQDINFLHVFEVVNIFFPFHGKQLL
jgi:hypothetical protein